MLGGAGFLASTVVGPVRNLSCGMDHHTNRLTMWALPWLFFKAEFFGGRHCRVRMNRS